MTTTAPNSLTCKRNKWGRISLYALLLTFALLIGLSIWLTVAGNPEDQFRISPETTVLTEPLTEDGLVDYAEAIRRRNREEVPPEENAARLLLEAIGPQAFNSDEEARQVYEQLQMEPLAASEEGEYLTKLWHMTQALTEEGSFDRERASFVDSDQLDYCMRYPWSEIESPEIASWIAVNETPLEKVAAASRLLHFRPPILDSDDYPLIFLNPTLAVEMREIAGLLTARAMQRLELGDDVGAWEDVYTLQRFARRYSECQGLTGFHASAALYSYATCAMRSLLQSPSPALLETIRNDWRQLPAWYDAAEIINTNERFALLDYVQWSSRDAPRTFNYLGGLSGGQRWYIEHPVMTRAFNALVDWDEAMQEINHWCDAATIALSESDPVTRGAHVREYVLKVDRLRDDCSLFPSTKTSTAVIVCALMTDIEGIHHSLLRRDARDAIIETALAVEQFRFDHGRIPSSLNELVPDYMDAVPLDPCAPVHELIYITHPDDAYVLYSVGHDGVDDGGTSERDDVIFQVRMPVPEMPRFEPQ